MLNQFLILLNKFFYIDRRSLDLFRVLLGFLIIYDLSIRISDYSVFYTDFGVLPLASLFDHEWSTWFWQKWFLVEASEFFWIYFIVGFTAALALIFGLQSRISLIVLFVIISIIQSRNPIIFQGGDDLIRLLVFWSIFLPFSKRSDHSEQEQISNMATAAILLQVLFPYFFSGLLKGKFEWWTKGSALYYAWNLDQLTRPIGKFIVQFELLSKFMTRVVYLFELMILPIFLIPFQRDVVRIIVFLSLLIFNLGILSSMMIGIFPLCFLVASSLFIPSMIWNYASGFKIKIVEIISNLKAFSKSDILPLNSDHLAIQSLIAFSLVLMILWNLSIAPSVRLRFPSAFRPMIIALRVEQSWGMFAPTVFKEDGWILAQGRSRSGKIYDLTIENGDYNEVKPKYLLDKFKNDRWRKFTEQLLVPSRSYLRSDYKAYLISKWNSRNTDSVDHIELYYMKELTKPFGEKMFVEKVELKSPLTK